MNSYCVYLVPRLELFHGHTFGEQKTLKLTNYSNIGESYFRANSGARTTEPGPTIILLYSSQRVEYGT